MSHASIDISSNHALLLRTSDQHDAWRLRVTDKCWAKTGKDILLVTDAVCIAALSKIHKEDAKADDYAKHGWVTTCWNTITKSLHDEILLKVAHVERGHIETLLKEIASSLTVFTQDEVSPLRLDDGEVRLGFAELHRIHPNTPTKTCVPQKGDA